MKPRSVRTRLAPPVRNGAWPQSSCSLLVLAGMGLISFALPLDALAQRVPAPNTLPVLRSVISGNNTWVRTPTTTAGGRSLLTIDQGDQRAIIDWRSFDIGANAEVLFRQPGVSASALNRIYDAVPSVIRGRLSSVGPDGTAASGGQIILINQNGIVFNRGAQVNTQLVASSLNISNERFLNLGLTSGGLTTPAFEGGYNPDPEVGNGLIVPLLPGGPRPGAISLGGGDANAPAPLLQAPSGGSIMLFAPSVDNQGGIIKAPDGQVLLAAGSKVYLALNDDPKNLTLRGYVVEVEAVPDGPALNLTSLIQNTGDISADRGNVTLAGLAVNQNGRVSASTAIQANGSVYLTAKAKVADGGQVVTQAGTVSLGAGSVTEVRPDAADKATLAESQSYLDKRGEIKVEGRTIASSGTLQASGGKITLEAKDAADPSGARVYLDAGSTTSVAGNWADVAFADNLLTFKVTSNELKDSPDQKTGILKGATVTVDLRKGSPLLNLDGYIAAQGRTVGQKAAVGGQLDISSTGALIQRSGATLDASGGGYRYGAGTAPTSVLLGADGRLYDIGSAAEQRPYSGQVDSYTKTDARWGQTQVFRGGTYGIGKSEAAYLEGKAGGSITLNSAAGLVLDGQLKGGVTVGPNQMAAAPRGASLRIGDVFDANTTEFGSNQRIGHVGFAQMTSDTLGAAFNLSAPLSSAQTDNVTLAAEQIFGRASMAGQNAYVQSAFDSVELNSNGRIVVPEGVHIDGAPGSSLVLRSPQIEVAGAISMPGGSITLRPVDTLRPLTPDLSADKNSVTVRSGASLSTAGVWVNNASADGSFVGDALPSGRLNVVLSPDQKTTTTTTSSMLTGGKLTISSNGAGNSATVLESDAMLDVGGGAALSSGRKLTLGDGGTLSIANGLSSSLSADWLRADLSGYSAGNGGKLVLSTPRVVLEGADASGTLPPNTTALGPELFSERGFSSVTINTIQGVDITADARITLQQKNRVIDSLQASALATGGDLRQVSKVELLPDHLRHAVDLSLSSAESNKSTGAVQGQAILTMAAGSVIQADPKATVSLSAENGLQVDGHIIAPGGTVLLNLAAPARDGLVTPDLSLGSTAVISAAGTFVPKPTLDGTVQGSVIGGGNVAIKAMRAGVNLAEGASIDVSGITQVLQLPSPDGRAAPVSMAVDGNAGSLLISSQGSTQLGATLKASSGSPQGAGGAFALELKGLEKGADPVAELRERRIIVTQQVPGVAPIADPAFADAALAIDDLRAAGFDKLRLQSENRIELRGDVALDFARGIRFDAPLIDVTQDGRASLRGASVALGQSLAPRDGAGTVMDLGASPVLPTRAGSGVLSVQANTIDLFGSVTLNGIAQARLFSEGDIRMTGRAVASPAGDRSFGGQIGSLTTSGDLLLSATQLYPSTRSDFTLSVVDPSSGAPRAGGNIVIASNGKSAGDVYSAGGKLALMADNIVQSGVVKAPLGEIDLRAGSRLELAPGSVTSVSADGLTVPFGSTSGGISWSYLDNAAGGNRNSVITASADSKRIELTGQTIDVQAGAKVDLSGGGEIQAREFVPGIGGTKDVLAKPDTYAIIPKSQLSSMPVDTDLAVAQDIGFGLLTNKYDTSVYDQLHIGRGAIVPEGDYVLLPARYALLPNAYLVQLQTGSTYAHLSPGQTTQLLNGQAVVAGYRVAGGTTVRESNTVGVVVRPGSAATRESDYTLTTSSYLAEQAANNRTPAPRLPMDAGHLLISNTTALTLGGEVVTTPGTGGTVTEPTTGRAAQIDISAERIAVVDRIGSDNGIDAGYLQLEGRALSALGGSLLLGGKRTADGDGVRISTEAQQIVVANTAAGALSAPELLLSAADSIELRSGSVLTGAGATAGSTVTSIKAEGDGALLRLSGGAQASVDRGMTAGNAGTIRIDDGAVLNAAGSLLLDATRSMQSQGRLAVAAGGAVSLASSKVSLGETATVADIGDGLVLSNTALANLASLDTLLIKGYDGIDLFGNAQLGSAATRQLTLDTAALRGHAVGSVPAAAQIAAREEVRLINTGSQPVADAAVSSGTLAIDAQRIVVGAGAQKINGYDTVTMTATNEMVGQGTGSLAVGGDWRIRAPKVGMAAGADQTWQAADLRDAANPLYSAFTLAGIAGSAAGVGSTDNAAGGRLHLEGRSVEVATTVQARSGAITVAARGGDASDGVTLATGAVVDVHGLTKDYHGNVVAANAGQVNLSATQGAVTLAAGSTVDTRGVGGGDAGSLRIAADTVALQGTLQGTAEATAASGRFALDVKRGDLLDFSVLNTALNSGGFNEAREIRYRQGDLRVRAADVVQGRELSLSADAGRIDIEGTLHARSSRGGAKVDVWAANGLSLTGAQVLADGTGSEASAALSDGGQVRMGTAGGTLSFDAGSVIDVRPGAKGKTGNVSFTVARDAANVVAPVSLDGTVRGIRGANGNAAQVALEAQRVYDANGGLDLTGYAADHAAFINGNDGSALLGGLRGDVNATLRGATELRSTGDLNVDTAWDLTSSDWLAGGKAGTLTLRAGGNLTIGNALGMPNDNLLAGDTWNLKLVGGADLTAANAMAVKPLAEVAGADSGNVLLSGNTAKVRTGTGSIEIAAAADFRLGSTSSVVYTAGKIGAADTAANGNNRWSQGGGSISIKAGRDASGVDAPDELVTEWMRRNFSRTNILPAEWWVYRPNFQQGVGTLGGGDVRIEAGRDVRQLSAMLPTTGRNADALDVQGGGNLQVHAGNDVVGGSFLVSRGLGQIVAGGDVGGSSLPTQLFLMGVSSGEAPAQANVSVVAGRGVAVQSVDNPTALPQDTSTPGLGPGLGNGGGNRALTFFTYSPNSSVQLLAESGDLNIGYRMAGTRRLRSADYVGPAEAPGAYPATLIAAALNGDISLESTAGSPIVTFPSPQSTVSLLANGSVFDPNLIVSDRAPDSMNDVSRPLLWNAGSGSFSSFDRLVSSNLTGRIVDRPVSAGLRFDIQGLNGDVRSSVGLSDLRLPAESRIRAGRDIRNLALTLQNLDASDVSEVRADTGDVVPTGIEMRGPGSLLIQAGRNVDVGTAAIINGPSNLGGIIATGNNANQSLANSDAAHLTITAGVRGDVNPALFKATYEDLIALNGQTDAILAFYRALNGDADRAAVRSATSVQDLAARDKTYAAYVALVTRYPGVLRAYQTADSTGSLPLGTSAEARQATALYELLNRETDAAKIANARSLADLAQGTQGGNAYAAFAGLDALYPRVFADYRARRGRGALPQGLTPIIMSDALAEVTALAVPAGSVGKGSIFTPFSSIQTYGNSRQPDSSCVGQCSGQGDIDLWAPGGSVIAGLTTPIEGITNGVVTNGGGAIRSVVGNDFIINQGKVLTAQGGDILIYSSGGSVDAGRGAKTSLSTPPPTKTPILGPNGEVTGYTYTIPASASGSGIQTLTSDPDGIGPRTASAPGSIYLFAPAGAVDAGEAGIRSSGNIVIAAQTVLNASNISAGGSAAGVPVAVAGSLASSLAASGGTADNGAKAAQDAAKNAAEAARAATASGVQKPNILTVEVMGFGDKNCKEQEKDCFAK